MLNRMLTQAGTIAIGGHVKPDGDCIGSSMGLYQYIRDNYKEKQVDVYLEETLAAYECLKGVEEIRHEITGEEHYDLFICLDCADKSRLGFSLPLFESADHTLCIDHHVSNGGYAEENYVVPDSSSTSELFYELAEKE